MVGCYLTRSKILKLSARVLHLYVLKEYVLNVLFLKLFYFCPLILTYFLLQYLNRLFIDL